jgi:hypothetical protein
MYIPTGLEATNVFLLGRAFGFVADFFTLPFGIGVERCLTPKPEGVFRGVSKLLWNGEGGGIHVGVEQLLTLRGVLFLGVSRTESVKNRQSISFASASTDLVFLSSMALAMMG